MTNRDTSLLISEAQDTPLSRQARGLGNGIDLNYLGHDTDSPSIPFVYEGTDALKNRVLFWFLTKPGDFIRETGKAGVLYNFLSTPLTNSGSDDLDFMVRSNFSTTFQGDLTLETLSIAPNFNTHQWEVHMIVSDPINRELFDLSLGVSV